VRILAAFLVAAVMPSSARADQVAPPQQEPIDLLWRSRATEEAEAARPFSVVGLSLGTDHKGSATGTGRGRFFAPFGRRSALQVEGSFDWYDGRREGQLDVGLVNRVRTVQLGLFSSVRRVNLDGFAHGGWLAQVGGTADYLFGAGRVGVFATAAVEDTALLERRLSGRNIFQETSLHVVDQFGVNGQFEVTRLQIGGHIATLKPTGLARTTGGSVRVAYPVSDGWALTAEGAWNASLVTSKTHGRFVVGIRMGEWPSARAASASTRPAPIEIPAIRYQSSAREVREGNDGPVADAGPDQVFACPLDGDGLPIPCILTVTLDGSGSFDPDGDALTYRWLPRSGFTDGEFPMPATTSRVTFLAECPGTYVIRLQVTDQFGATAFDDVTITLSYR
jgi:hypothetical protein